MTTIGTAAAESAALLIAPLVMAGAEGLVTRSAVGECIAAAVVAVMLIVSIIIILTRPRPPRD